MLRALLVIWVLGLCSVARPAALSLKRDVIKADITVTNLIRAIDKIAFYYFKHKKEATIDFAFGLRAVEGEIFRLLHMTEIGEYPAAASNEYAINKLKELLQTIQMNLKQSLPHIEKNAKEYFSSFFPLVKEKWTPYQFPPQYTAIDRYSFPNATSTLEEKDSDKCMVDLMGSGASEKCTFAPCWERMVTMETARYVNTHQILWLLLGDKMGCREQMDKRARSEGNVNGIDDILKRKCASAIIEMEAITQDGVRRGLIDIFLEQGFICGSIGFMDAVRPEWLKLAFQWQDPTLGCFEEIDSPSDDMKEYLFWINYKREQWKSRNLKVDSVIHDGCSTHTSAVGAAFFATYLRLFFDPIYKKSQLDPQYPPQPVAPVVPPYTWWSYVKVFVFVVLLLVVLRLELKRRASKLVFAYLVRNCYERWKRKTQQATIST